MKPYYSAATTFFLFILWAMFAPTGLQAQTNISGVINDYTQVTAINACLGTIDVASTAGFIPNRKVLIIQMKGATLDQANTAAFGNITSLGVAGNYEFNRIASVSGNTIALETALTRQYDPANVVQLVTVPEYTDVTISAPLTCNYWNNGVGGILVFEASGTVTMNAGIDVSERGFRQGLKGGPGPNNNCTQGFFFSTAQNLAGFKGEGLAVLPAGFEQGRGKWAQGGGGGNNHNTGGGGGGNGGAGGGGGTYNGCDDPANLPGVGGIALPYSNVDQKLYMAGGGGGGHDNNGVGGDGGVAAGMVIISAAAINGNGQTIFANGQDGKRAATAGSSSDGAGAGGAGGTVILNVGAYASALTVQARGGLGGPNVGATDAHGTAGGGGGGFVWYSGAALPANVTLDLAGGGAGLCQDNNCLDATNRSQPGQPGNSLGGLVFPAPAIAPFVPLSATSTQIDALCFGVCSGSIDITAANGFPPYTYSWSNGSVNEDLIGICAGNYTVTVTDSRNCTFTVAVTISQPASALSATFTKTDNPCIGNLAGTIDLTPTGGTAPYIFLWDNGATTEDLANLAAGNYCVTVTDANSCTFPICATITEPALGIAATFTQTNINCFGDNNGTINVNVTGAQGTPAIVWTPPTFSGFTLTGLAPGVYSFTISDASNCQATGTVTITTPAAPLTLTATQTDVNCFGDATGAIDLAVSGGTSPYSYSWNNGQFTTQDLANLPAAIYNLRVTDANGCTATLSRTILQPTAALSATAIKVDVDCRGNATGSINVTTTGGTAPYVFSWSNNAASEDVSGLLAGTYTLNVTDANGCTFSLSETITEPAAVLAATATATDALCNGATNGSVQLSVSGGTQPYSFSWNNAATSQNLNAVGAGTYTVTVTDKNNCATTAQATVNQPTPLQSSIVPTNVVCNGFSTGAADLTVSGGTPPYSYLWNNGFAGEDRTNLPAGNYSVTITDNQGCTATNAVTITQNPPTVVLISPSQTQICLGQSVNLKGSNVVSYLWNTGETLPDLIVSPQTTTTYSVVGTDANGCTATAAATVTVNPLPVLIITPSVASICLGQSQSLSVSGAVTYSWLPGALNGGTVSVSPQATTTYTVTGTDANGCTSSATVTLTVFPDPVPDFSNDAVCFPQQNVLDAAVSAIPAPGQIVSYEWDFENNGSIDATGETISVSFPEGSRDVKLIVTSADGCKRPIIKQVTTLPEPHPAIASASVCLGETAFFNGIFSTVAPPGQISEFHWDFESDGVFDATGPQTSKLYSAAGEYLVTLRTVTLDRCEASIQNIQYVRPLPNPAFNAPQFVCQGSEAKIEYTGTPLTGQSFQWDFAGGVYTQAPNQEIYFVKWNTLGARTVTLTVTADGCSQTLSQTVTVVSNPVVDAGSDKVLCKGQTTKLDGQILNASGTSNCFYQWTSALPNGNFIDDPSLLQPTVQPLVTTTYSLLAVCNGCVSAIDEITVLVSEPPVVVAPVSEYSLCYGGASQPLYTEVFGGVGDFYYDWQPTVGLSNAHAANPVANPTQSTTYTLTVIDSVGCRSNTVLFDVTVHPLPIANAGADQYLCKGQQAGVFLNGSADGGGFGSYNYHWIPETGLSNPFIANPYASPDTTTIYQLIVTSNQTGCGSMANTLDTIQTVRVFIQVPPVAHAFTGDPDTVEICQGESIILGGFPSEVMGPDTTFIWTPTTGLSNPHANFPTASPEFTTTYQLTVISRDCFSDAATVTVKVKPRPTVAVKNVQEVCPGEKVQLDAAVLGGSGDYTYQWSPPDGLSDPAVLKPFASPAATTTYTLKVFSAGCSSPTEETALVQVLPIPTISINPNNTLYAICPEQDPPMTINAVVNSPLQPYSVRWSPGAGLSDSTLLNPTVKPQETTTYTLFVTLGACTVSETLTVVVHNVLKADFSGGRDTICEGENVVMTASGGSGSATYTWTWTDADGSLQTVVSPTLNVSPHRSTDYVLTASESICRSTKIIRITVIPGVRPEFAYSWPTGCEGLTVSFQDQSVGYPNQYIWDFGDGSPVSNERNPVHTYTAAGVYRATLSVGSSNGCFYNKTGAEIRVQETAFAEYASTPHYPDTLYLPFATVQFKDSSQNAATYHWNFGDGFSAEKPNPEHAFQTPGVYFPELTIADPNGCIYTVKHGPYVVLPPVLEIPNVFTPNNGDGLNDLWKPWSNNNAPYQVKVFDRWGNLLYAANEQHEGWNGQNPAGGQAPAGVYFYIVKMGDRTFKGNLTLIR